MRAQLYGRVIVAITRHSHRRIVGRRSRVVVVLMHFSFPCVIVPARTHARPLTLDVEEDRLRCLRAESRGGLFRRPSQFCCITRVRFTPESGHVRCN
jgi:hypothetical protein